MILFDIDDLASLNRTFGHAAGDSLLERLRILARHFFRTHDSAARQGGDLHIERDAVDEYRCRG